MKTSSDRRALPPHYPLITKLYCYAYAEGSSIPLVTDRLIATIVGRDNQDCERSWAAQNYDDEQVYCSYTPWVA